MGPTGQMALLEWHKWVTCSDFPRLPPGKVSPKMHLPPGLGPVGQVNQMLPEQLPRVPPAIAMSNVITACIRKSPDM